MMKKIIFIVSIFVITILQAQEVKIAEITVVVTDFENLILKGEQVVFVGQTTKKKFKGVSDSEGKFVVNLDGGDTYNIKLKSIGKAKDYNTIKIPEIGEGQFFPPSQMSLKLSPAKMFTLDNVYFETGKSQVKIGSMKEINELATYLKYKEDVTIEIGGHTDNVGSDESNQLLSQARANKVKYFLVKKGIEPSRIKTVGYGESIPRASNVSAEGRQKNRRTEVKILN